jgi:hypothetical protein
MSCRISLGPNDDLELITPTGRRVYIPLSPYATKEIWQVLWNASAEHGPRSIRCPGRDRDDARKAAWDKVEKENAAWNEAAEMERLAKAERGRERREAARAAKKASSKYGINLKELDFSL